MFRTILAAAIGLVAATATAVPLSFGGFNGNIATAQDGFTVAVIQVPDYGSWSGGAGQVGASGSPVPMFTSGQHTGTFEINRSGGLFFFNSVDIAVSLNEFFLVSITGLFNGVTQFQGGGPLTVTSVPPGGVQPYFNTFLGNSSLAIDSLLITVQWDPSVAAGFTVGNIDVKGLVPDSTSTFALLGLSAAALIVFGRRQPFLTKP